MADTTFLEWPFFTDAHRALASELESWSVSHIVPLLDGDYGTDWPGGHDGAELPDEYETSRRIVALLGGGGWLAHTVPADAGGVHERPDVRSLCLIRETLARFGSLADFAFAMQALGAMPVWLFGTAAQRQAYLPRVASGAAVAAFALSEEQAGSDVAAIATTARRDGDDYVLDGGKTWISNAGIADFYVVFARTGDGPGAKGLSAFLVDADAPGFEVSGQIDITSPHPLGTLRFTDCRVPASSIIGAPGEGFKVAMATLDVMRSTVGAAALGFARRALDEAAARAGEREAFGRPIGAYQLIQQKLADMATEVDASALLVYRAAWRKDSGAERVVREAAMAKMYATEAAQRVIDQAVQIFGGQGVVTGTPVETLYRDIRPLRIYEGTTEILKLVIAREVLKENE